MIGKVINDRYEILNKLGGGGMSTVYLANDTILNRKVAVKAINIPANEKDDTIMRFEREVHNLTQLSHPNIVNVFDVTENDDNFFLVMEYIQGLTLSEYIQKHKPLDLKLVLNFINQILEGIKHAHATKIVHRDIKPQNILVDQHQTLKILDFGIAKALSETTMTQTNHVLGTVQYLSPEQARGETTDNGTDIYSIGVVLYEMLVGKPPFTGETAIGIAIKHLQTPMPNATEKRHVVPQALSNVILKATEKNKEDRYQSVEEMQRDLDTVLSTQRENEKVYNSSDDSAETVKINKSEINEKTKKETQGKNIKKTMEIPIVNQQQFQSDESHQRPKKPQKKSKRKIVLYTIIVTLLLLALIAFLAIGMFGHKFLVSPDIVGKTEKTGQHILEKNNLKVGNVSRAYSDKYPENKIIKTNPKKGERLEEGSKVDIVLSKGPKMVDMPNLYGIKKDEAINKLKNLGINDINFEQSYTTHNLDKGLIEKQYIDPGKRVKVNDSNITLTESLGIKKVYVDDYVNKPVDKAKSELEQKGLNVVVDKEQADKDIKKNNVISQTPKDKEVKEGSTVKLTVSTGSPDKADSKASADEDKEKSSDDTDTKKYTESVDVPYTGEDDDSQEVKVYIRDKDNDGTSAAETFKIKKDKTIKIPMTIEKGKTAGYTVRVDGDIVADKDIPYE